MKVEWKEFRLRDVATIKYGKMPPKKIISETGFPIFSGYGITGYANKYNCEKPELVVIARGVGGTGKVKICPPKSWVTNLCLILDVNPNFVNKYYLCEYLGLASLKTKLDTGSAQSQITINSLAPFKINLPPLPTQRKIASILSAYDDLIENNLKRIKLLEEKAQLTYEEWFVRMKFPGHETTPINEETGLPVGWEKKRIGAITKTSSGGTPSRKKESEYYENGTIPWVRTGELKEFILTDAEYKITESGLKNSSAKVFPKNTVLLAMYGNTIGETSFVTKAVSTNQACCAFLVGGKSYLSYYLHQYLLNNKDYILNYRMGAAQENISQTIIQNIKIILPSKDLLEKFEVECSKIYKSIEIIIYQNQLLKEARDILLPRLMSGMIEV